MGAGRGGGGRGRNSDRVARTRRQAKKSISNSREYGLLVCLAFFTFSRNSWGKFMRKGASCRQFRHWDYLRAVYDKALQKETRTTESLLPCFNHYVILNEHPKYHFKCELKKNLLKYQKGHKHTLFKNFVTTALWENISSSASSSSCSPRCLFS